MAKGHGDRPRPALRRQSRLEDRSEFGCQDHADFSRKTAGEAAARQFSRAILKGSAALALMGVSFAAGAEIIRLDFDELAPKTFIRERYRDLGVVFYGGTVVGPTDGSPEDGIVSSPNGLSDFRTGPGLYLQFSGAPVTSISVNVTGIFGDRVYVDAFNETGVVDSAVSNGWGGTPELSTPWVPEQLITLSADHIGALVIQNLYPRPGTLVIDNLTFTTASVPEPAVPALVGAGLLAALAGRRRAGRGPRAPALHG